MGDREILRRRPSTSKRIDQFSGSERSLLLRVLALQGAPAHLPLGYALYSDAHEPEHRGLFEYPAVFRLLALQGGPESRLEFSQVTSPEDTGSWLKHAFKAIAPRCDPWSTPVQQPADAAKVESMLVIIDHTLVVNRAATLSFFFCLAPLVASSVSRLSSRSPTKIALVFGEEQQSLCLLSCSTAKQLSLDFFFLNCSISYLLSGRSLRSCRLIRLNTISTGFESGL